MDTPFISATVHNFEILRALYVVQLLISYTGAHFWPKIQTFYLIKLDNLFYGPWKMWREIFFQLDFEWCSSRDKLTKIWLQAWIWPSFSWHLSKIQKYVFEILGFFSNFPFYGHFLKIKNFSKKIPLRNSVGLLS